MLKTHHKLRLNTAKSVYFCLFERRGEANILLKSWGLSTFIFGKIPLARMSVTKLKLALHTIFF